MTEKNFIKREKSAIFQNGCAYSFTYCPNDAHQFISKKTGRFMHFRNWFIETYRDLFLQTVREFKLYPDLSFPVPMVSGKYPRIHYHGIIIFKDIYTFMLKSDLHEIASVKIDIINDMAKWMVYCEAFLSLNIFGPIPPKIIELKDMQLEIVDEKKGQKNILEYMRRKGGGIGGL